MEEVRTAARERLARLLSSSPAVIYSFNATGDYAPTVVSENIQQTFGYETKEYLATKGIVTVARDAQTLIKDPATTKGVPFRWTTWDVPGGPRDTSR